MIDKNQELINKKLKKLVKKFDPDEVTHTIKQSAKETYGAGFKPYLNSKHTYVAIKGSRGSKKSVNVFRRAVNKIVGQLVEDMVTKNSEQSYINVLVIRKYLTDHGGSTRQEIIKAIHLLGYDSLFKIPKAENTITYLPKNTCFYFRGMDDVQSITSIACEVGYITDVIFEEAFQITNWADVEKVLWSIRGIPAPYYPQFTFIFNSWNENHWLNDKFFKPAPKSVDFTLDDYDNWYLAKTTQGKEGDITRGYNKWCEYEHPEFGNILIGTANFMDNEFLSKLDFDRYHRLRQKNPEQFQVIGLGNWGTAEGQIFNHYRVVNFDIAQLLRESRDPVTGKQTLKMFNGLDFGFSISPTCFINCFVDEKKSIIYINYSWEEMGITNPEIVQRLIDTGFSKALICADAAEPKSIEEIRRLGINWIRAGQKLEIKERIALLKSYEIYIHPRCTNVIDDFKNCIYDVDRNTNKPKVPERWSKEHNLDPHSIDALSYALGKLHKGGLGFN